MERTETFRTRVPHWVRVPAVVLGGQPPFKQIGTAFYERLLEQAVLKFMRTGLVSHIYLRGGAGRGQIHPGLSDLDLIVVSPVSPVTQIKEHAERIQEVIKGLRKSWHPVNDVAWLVSRRRGAASKARK